MGEQTCQVPRHRELRVNNEPAAGAARGKGGAASVMKQQTLDVSWTFLAFCESRTSYMFFPLIGWYGDLGAAVNFEMQHGDMIGWDATVATSPWAGMGSSRETTNHYGGLGSRSALFLPSPSIVLANCG